MKTDNVIEIYIHIPFCIRKCRYCDFLSFPPGTGDMDKYIDALIKEIRSKSLKDVMADTVFIGGGTPSLLPSLYIDKIMDELKTNFIIKDNAEITIEANPGTIDEDKAYSFVKNGINRVSIGLQSASDEALKKLGRIHTWQQFKDSYQIVREAGISNINVDIMSGLPLQTTAMYEENLYKVCEMKPEHISAYSLIIEEGTPFYGMYNEESGSLLSELPDEEEERKQYYLTSRILSEYGYSRYEISNYAKSGYECRHNTGYWMRKPYLGFGIGAASLYGEKRFSNIRDMKQYFKWSGSPGRITENIQSLTVKEQMEEYMFLGLRMSKGVSKKQFRETFHKDMEEVYGMQFAKYKAYKMMCIDGDRVYLTDKGIDVSNTIFADFL